MKEKDYTAVSLSTVENEIISAIEETDTDDKMGPQSPIWNKIYRALEKIRNCSYEDYWPDA